MAVDMWGNTVAVETGGEVDEEDEEPAPFVQSGPDLCWRMPQPSS